MPTFRVPIQCQYCGHRFVAMIQTKPDDGPDTEYMVCCPSNASEWVVYRRDLTDEMLKSVNSGGKIRAIQAPPVPNPWYARSPWPVVIPVIWLLLAGLVVLVLIAYL